MNVFSGNVPHTMDSKGRVTIPVLYREALGNGFTIGLSNDLSTIALYPCAYWQQIERDLEKIPPSDVRGMRYVRMINGNSFPDNTIDAQGRVLLPPSLRQRTKMDKNVRFVGVGRCLEVWDETRYAQEEAQLLEDGGELVQYVYEQYYQPQ